jgi:hypothetical protein
VNGERDEPDSDGDAHVELHPSHQPYAGVAAETGVVMLIYLDHALTEWRTRCATENRTFTREDLRAAIMAGAVERVRPKMMTPTRAKLQGFERNAPTIDRLALPVWRPAAQQFADAKPDQPHPQQKER